MDNLDTTTNSPSSQSLVEKALTGDSQARAEITSLADQMIRFQTDRFCRRFCYHQKHQLRCTLTPPVNHLGSDAPMCDQANASYTWMLDDLTNNKRLANHQGNSLKSYFFTIVNSLPFYERWKDFRFGRRVYVPDYVKDLAPAAKVIFLSLRDGDSVPIAAQKAGVTESDCDQIAQQIMAELTARNKLHLLDPPTTQNFSELEQDEESFDETHSNGEASVEQWYESTQLSSAWKQLDVVEQFVLEAMVIEQQDAEDVLLALAEMDISIKKGVAADKTNRQQLYYYKRKCIAKLSDLLHSSN